MLTIAAGARAPEFTLLSANAQPVKLADYRGTRLVLAFYPADWSRVCSNELTLIQEMLEAVRERGAEIMGLSVDSHFSHRAFAEDRHLTFPLLSDAWPHGAVARAYGVFRERDGISERALYFIDDNGLVSSSWISPDPAIAPGINLVFKGLEKMRGAHFEEARRV